MKAMRKDRTRRYRSASELADDIQNYLTGTPLIAGPESTIYRARKFVRKHAGSVATAALLLVVIVLGLVASIVMGCRAEQARKQEAAARTQVEQALVRAENAEKAAREKSERLRRTLYVNSIQLADAKYREANIRRVRELLESCPNDLRGWEWYRLNHIADQSRMTLRGHDDFVGSIAFSPDGKRIVSGSDDNTIKVWDAETGDELMTLRGHKESVKSVAFSPDGKRIVSGSDDKTIKIWDAATGVELMTLHGHGREISLVAFSPNGKCIVSGSADNTIKVWDAANGAEVMTLRGHKFGVSSVAFSPDGKRIASGSGDKTIKIWDAATGTELMTLRGHGYWYGYIDSISIAFSPDGKRIISGCEDDKTVKVWDSATGAELMTLRGHGNWVDSIAFSPDGKRIISGSWDNTIKVWDSATGAELMTLRGHGDWVSSIAISPDGKRIVSGSGDKTIKVWDAAIRAEAVTLSGHQAYVLSIAFSPDSKRIVSGSVDRAVKIWDAATGAELMTLRGHDNGVLDALFSPDGKQIISGGYDKTIKVWDAATGAELMTLHGHESYVRGVAFSPDGKRIVSGGYDNTIKVWDAETGDELMTLRGHKGCVKSVAFGPEGKRIVSGSDDKTIKIWDAANGTELRTLRGHSHNVLSVAFCPDGKRIISGSVDRTVKLWDAASGAELMTLRGHRNWIEPVAFSPDGKRIISGSGDNTINVWDSATGAELMTLHVDAPSSIAFSPDGKTIAAGIYDYDNNIQLWESTTPGGGYEPRWSAKAARKVVDELVDELYEETGFHSEVIDRLKADKTLAEPVREAALQIASARLWDAIQKLERESFEVVRLPGERIEAYRLALGKVEMANRLDPNNPHILIILGLAQYRVGEYQDALTTLIGCENWRPGPFVFKAMALHQLGSAAEAREELNQAHVLLEDWEFGAYFVVRPFVIEAEKLLASEGTKLYSVWESIEESRLKEAVQMIEELCSSEDAEATTCIEGAIKSLRRAYHNRAQNKMIDGEFAEAISDYEAAARVDPNHAPALNDLAWLRATCPVAEFRDGAKSVEQASKASELTDWKMARYVGTLAAAYAETGDFDSAVKQQKKAIDLLTEEEEELRADFEERLKLYQSGKPYRQSP